MGLGHPLECLPRCREGEKEAALALAGSLQQELEAYGGLACARAPFQQVHLFLREAAPEDVIEALDPRGHAPQGISSGECAIQHTGSFLGEKNTLCE